jgi:hypothetical protein
MCLVKYHEPPAAVAVGHFQRGLEPGSILDRDPCLADCQDACWIKTLMSLALYGQGLTWAGVVPWRPMGQKEACLNAILCVSQTRAIIRCSKNIIRGPPCHSLFFLLPFSAPPFCTFLTLSSTLNIPSRFPQVLRSMRSSHEAPKRNLGNSNLLTHAGGERPAVGRTPHARLVRPSPVGRIKCSPAHGATL